MLDRLVQVEETDGALFFIKKLFARVRVFESESFRREALEQVLGGIPDNLRSELAPDLQTYCQVNRILRASTHGFTAVKRKPIKGSHLILILKD